MATKARPSPVSVGQTCRSAVATTVETAADGKRSTFTFMTGGVKRDGWIVEPAGGDVANYLRNPVVLWGHGFDFTRGDLPIARAENVRMVDEGWAADVVWFTDDFSSTISEMVRDGFVSAVSMGWRNLDAGWETRDGKEVYVVKRWEMLEFSLVSVPADADAMVTKRAGMQAEIAELRARVAELEGALDGSLEAAPPTETPAPEPTPEPAPEPDPPPTPPAEEPAAPKLTDAQIEAIATQQASALMAYAESAFNRAVGRA